MSVYTFEQMARRAAISSVSAYQRYLSPRKGFVCPYRILYQGESCSEYIKQTLGKQDLLSTLQVAPARFRACRQAAITLSSNATGSNYIKQQGGCIVIPCCIPI